MDHQVRFSAVQ